MSSPFSVSFANPSRVLGFAGELLSPLRILRLTIWPLAVFALIAGAYNWYDLQANLDRALSTFNFFQNLLISMVTANLISRLVMGMTMSYMGVPPHEFGLRLLFGVIPRFYVSTAAIQALDFPQQRVCYAAPLLTRLGLFAFGVLIWVLMRRGGTGAADAALVLGATGLGAFLFTANPLWRADGYMWMTAYFRMPDLREQSYRLLSLILRGKPIPEMLSRREIRGLLFYAVVSIVFTTVLILLILSTVAFALEEQFRGTGVVMFAAILAMVMAFLISRRSRGRERPVQKRRERAVETSRRGDISCYTTPKDISDEAEPDGSEAMAQQHTGKSNRKRQDAAKNRPDETSSELEDLLGQQAAPGDAAATADLDAELEKILGPSAAAPAPKSEFDEILDAALTALPAADPEPVAAAQAPAQSPAPRQGADGRRRQPPQSPPRASDNLDHVLKIGKARRTRGSRLRALLIWALLLGGIYWVAIQPYPFSVGGEFFVSPLERVQVRARTNGEITRIHVNEGDWVTEGQVLAELSDWEEAGTVALLEADLERLEAQLASLLEAPREEEIRVAEQDINAASAREAQALAEKNRQEGLVQAGAAAQKSLEEAETLLSLATAMREQAEARLALLKSDASESELAAARASIARKTEEIELSKLRLKHTKILAPADGQVVSAMQKIAVGTFLREGDLLAELTDSSVVMAEIEVPETEIDEASIGAEVTMKLWRRPDEVITGTVQRVAPVAEEREFGRVVRVIVEVPNPDGKISRNLTGYGKIIVDERPVWEVFSRVFIRFFKIEIWSWLP
ncbi:HlyD family efflux transporter periplasmic adaptor subunit [Roseovarius faecimaris]|uniref:HlyD family efflux transporter periplasmic adaptor subunit n=1 Tax=Roseovarius faecimaris TaxID=2494550 RepID=A0A6I6IW33_9RHOB|nr:HlyD family efflux transporter periplasmic adaptor subunit [Roseovarius faecimaris]QGX99841.1 HlyD family efflux transporter periplasmic adaptor subunit [Roseovarius faecimaris]